jgi:HPt (histidine-containing phosphotransfer) domain-containing protein
MDDGDPFADLRGSFRLRLAERMREIEEAWEAARAAGDALEPLRHLHRLVHSLAGAAGTFGYPEVSAAARLLERRAKELLLAPGHPGGSGASELAFLLATLRRVADAS